MVEHDIELAVDKGARPCGPSVVARVGDVGTQTVTARLTRDSQPYSPSGVSARLEVLKADGTWCRCDAQLSGDEVTCVLPSQALSSPGVARLAYFVLFSGDDAESTESFELRVLPHVDSSGPESENYDDQLTQLYNEYVAKLGGLDSQYEQAEQQRDSQYASAEAARNQSFQQAQTQRQTDYEQAEAARDAAQAENDSAQDANDAAQTANDSAQAKNNADQQLNNQMAQGLQVVILSSGQYDPDTLEPTVSGEAGKLYFVPAGSGDDEDAYVEWMWVGSAWERVGMSNATIEAITTDQVDSVVADGSPQGEQVLNLTGLSYLWAKVKAWATGAFAALSHTHPASQVTGLTASRALVSDSSGHPAASAVTATELGYLDGVTSGVQGQIDALGDSLSQWIKPNISTTNPLLISLSNPSSPANQPSKIVADAGSLDGYQNLPAAWTSGPIFAYRSVQVLSSNHVAVWLFESYPQRRIWANFYNIDTWSGWEQI